MQAVLRFGTWSERAEIGDPSDDGVVFLSIHGSTWMPFKDTGERTPDELPVFSYAL